MNTTKRNGLSFSAAGKLGYLAAKNTIQKQKQKRIDKYNLNPIKCLFCGNGIPYEKRHFSKFCGHSCAAVFNNKKRGFDSHKLEKENYCLLCKTKIDPRRDYCGKTCFGIKKTEDMLKKIDCGEYTIKSNKSYKLYLIKKKGHKCELCGFTEWLDKPILLILDHINGNSDDYSLENLRVICSNCDSTLSTYKNRNAGNGRYSRRQRYAAGKSY